MHTSTAHVPVAGLPGPPAERGRRLVPTGSLHRTWLMVRHNVTLQLRDPAQLLSYMLIPMVVMLLLRPLYERAANVHAAQATFGPMVMFSVFAVSVVGNSILIERQWRTWDHLRTTPVGKIEVLLGKAVPVFLVLLLQQLVLIVFGSLLVGLPVPASFGYLVAAVVIWGLTVLSIGAALATVVRGFPELAVIGDFAAVGFSALGGALAPVHLMPEWLQAVAPFSPVYWALAMLRAAVEGDAAGIVGPALICLAIGLVAGVFAVYRLSRGWNRRQF